MQDDDDGYKPFKTLSVGELIARLGKYPPEMAVWTAHDLHYGPILDRFYTDDGYWPLIENPSDAHVGEEVLCLSSLWLAPDDYNDLVWTDHKGQRQSIPCYADADDAQNQP